MNRSRVSSDESCFWAIMDQSWGKVKVEVSKVSEIFVVIFTHFFSDSMID